MIKNDEILDDLQLQGLHIIQKKSGFKFGIDAVLLSDFAKDAPSKATLDLCTGTGIIPVLLSGKTKTPRICGLEIQEEIADMAKRSVEYNKIENRVEILQGDLKNAAEIYGKGTFDKITCNPPYMKNNTAVKNETDTLSISRHEIACTLEDGISVSSALLRPKGRFFMVHRPFRLAEIMNVLIKYRLEPKRMQLVHPFIDKEPNMVLIEASKGGNSRIKVEKPLIVYKEPGVYTDDILKIYGMI